MLVSESLTMPVMRAIGLVLCLEASNILHLDRSLLRVTSVAASSPLLTTKLVGQAPCTVG